MIDRQDIIKAQLTHEKPFAYDLGGGKNTQCVPVRLVPPVAAADAAVSLNGAWRCARWPFAADEAALAGPGCDDGAWEQVQQPGKVFYYDPEEDGHAIEGWNRVTLGHVDENDGAVIRRRVKVPAAWAGKRILLRFDAIFPAGIVYLNGKKLGEQMSGLTPVEWDVTDLVQPGAEALVAVRLLRKHRWVQLDMVRHACEFTGLAQDACLHAVEPCHIADYHLISDLGEDLKTGTLKGQVELRNAGKADQKVTLTVGIGGVEQAVTVTVPAGGKAAADIAITLADVKLWNDEYPNLYDVTLTLTGAGPAQVVSYRTGFRRFVCKDGRATLNGNPVKFRGVNHLTFHPEFGMYTPKPWLRQCLDLMKKANVNAIRTHFLGPPALAELCDELGIYFLQELPIDWGHTYLWDPEVAGPVLQRLEGGVRRDRHHCSITVWSVGNENLPRNLAEHDDFFNHLHLFDEFVKALDPTRYTMFPPPGPANKIRGIFETRVGDIADTHYSFNLVRDFNKTDKLLTPQTWEAQFEETTREEAMKKGWSGVWFSSEYGIYNHIPDLIFAPYGSIIADTPSNPLCGESSITTFYRRLEEEWGYMRQDPTCLGGAYFPWLCSGGSHSNPWGWIRWGEDADWGMVTADLLPKPAFWAMRVLFSPVWFPKRLHWKPGQNELRFKLTNTYNSIDFKDCTLRTQMAGGGKYMGQMRTWRDIPIAGAPGETVEVVIPFWNERTRETLEQGGPVICRCHFLEPNGFRTVTWDILVTPPGASEVEEAMPVGPDAVL